MEARYSTNTHADPSSETETYTDNILDKDTVFCCNEFKEYCKKFPSWSYERGRFTIVDSITYEGSTQTPIGFCPFCGERIQYKQNKPPKAGKTRS